MAQQSSQITPLQAVFLTRHNDLIRQKKEILAKMEKLPPNDSHVRQSLEIYTTILSSVDRELGDLASEAIITVLHAIT